MTVFPKDTKTLALPSVSLNHTEAAAAAHMTEVQRRTEWTKVVEMDHIHAGKVSGKQHSDEKLVRSEEREEHPAISREDEFRFKDQKLIENDNKEREINVQEQKSEDSDAKPSHSYIALIAMAILSKPSKKVLLGDIYNYISDKFPYYRSKDKSWRNSIRHNLSLNECFIKAGRSENGKGNYWAIHPANLEDFANGDFRRRRARRRVRKTHGSLCTRYSSLAFPSQQAGFMSYRAATELYPHYAPFYVTPYNCVARKSSFAIENILAQTQVPTVAAPVEHYTPISPPLCATTLLRGGGGGGGYPVTSGSYTPSLSPPAMGHNTVTTPYIAFPPPNSHQVPTESWNDTWKKLKAQFQVRS